MSEEDLIKTIEPRVDNIDRKKKLITTNDINIKFDEAFMVLSGYYNWGILVIK